MNWWSLRNNQLKLLEIVEGKVVCDFEKFFEKVGRDCLKIV